MQPAHRNGVSNSGTPPTTSNPPPSDSPNSTQQKTNAQRLSIPSDDPPPAVGLWTKIKTNFKLKYVNRELNSLRKIDEKILKAVLGDDAVILSKIEEISPFLSSFIEAFLSQDNQDSKKKALEGTLFHLFANLTLHILPENVQEQAKLGRPLSLGYTAESLINEIAEKVALDLLDGFNAIDKELVKGTPNESKLFLPLTDKLLGWILPKNDPFWSTVEHVKKREEVHSLLADKLHEFSLPIVKFLETGTFTSRPLEIPEEFKKLGVQFILSASHRSIEEDKKFFKSLTGEDDVAVLLSHVAPPLKNKIESAFKGPIEKLLNFDKQASEKLIEAILLKGLSSISRTICAREVDSEQQLSTNMVVEQASIYLITLLRKRLMVLIELRHRKKIAISYPQI